MPWPHLDPLSIVGYRLTLHESISPFFRDNNWLMRHIYLFCHICIYVYVRMLNCVCMCRTYK